jgi:hypothetical protein
MGRHSARAVRALAALRGGMMDFIDQIQDIRRAAPDTYVRQRVQDHADRLSRAAQVQAAVELANEAVCRAATICYESVDRQPVNVDQHTYRILIPLPWGDSGYRYWGMRSAEARVLRAVLMGRVHSEPLVALFDYSDRQWFLNAAVYKSAAVALDYLKRNPIVAREWLRVQNDRRTRPEKRSTNRRTRVVRG